MSIRRKIVNIDLILAGGAQNGVLIDQSSLVDWNWILNNLLINWEAVVPGAANSGMTLVIWDGPINTGTIVAASYFQGSPPAAATPYTPIIAPLLWSDMLYQGFNNQLTWQLIANSGTLAGFARITLVYSDLTKP